MEKLVVLHFVMIVICYLCFVFNSDLFFTEELIEKHKTKSNSILNVLFLYKGGTKIKLLIYPVIINLFIFFIYLSIFLFEVFLNRKLLDEIENCFKVFTFTLSTIGLGAYKLYLLYIIKRSEKNSIKK